MISTTSNTTVRKFRLAEVSDLYIRIILTNQCNNSCAYCFKETGQGRDIGLFGMAFFQELVKIAEKRQITKIHFTGGEPLLENRIADYIGKVAESSVIELGLTTNGIILHAHAERLRNAGLRRINISLPSLRASRYRAVCGNDTLERVLTNIDLALDIGFSPVKINVPLYTENLDEIHEFMEYFLRKERVILRFFSILPNDGVPETSHLSTEQTTAYLGEAINRLPLDLQEEATSRVYFRPPFKPSLSICRTCTKKNNCQDQAKALRISRDGNIRLCLDNPKYVTRVRRIADLDRGISNLLKLYYG